MSRNGMPFNKAFVISFTGEHCASSQKRHIPLLTSYLTQKDKLSKRDDHITFWENKPRKLNPPSPLPLARINFPWIGRDNSAPRKWQVMPFISNQMVAQHVINKTLKGITPNSRIYINAHGSVTDSFITQKVVRINSAGHKEKLKVKIHYEKLAQMLFDTIPKHTKHHLEIKLLVCFPLLFAKNLMEALHRRGFTSTSVVAYTGKVRMEIATQESSCFRINRVQCIDEDSDRPVDIDRAKGGDKVVFHNYTGQVKVDEIEPYRDIRARTLELFALHKALTEELATCMPTSRHVMTIFNKSIQVRVGGLLQVVARDLLMRLQELPFSETDTILNPESAMAIMLELLPKSPDNPLIDRCEHLVRQFVASLPGSCRSEALKKFAAQAQPDTESAESKVRHQVSI